MSPGATGRRHSRTTGGATPTALDVTTPSPELSSGLTVDGAEHAAEDADPAVPVRDEAGARDTGPEAGPEGEQDPRVRESDEAPTPGGGPDEGAKATGEL